MCRFQKATQESTEEQFICNKINTLITLDYAFPIILTHQCVKPHDCNLFWLAQLATFNFSQVSLITVGQVHLSLRKGQFIPSILDTHSHSILRLCSVSLDSCATLYVYMYPACWLSSLADHITTSWCTGSTSTEWCCRSVQVGVCVWRVGGGGGGRACCVDVMCLHSICVWPTC